MTRIVWEAVLDSKYKVWVESETDAYKGVLKITEVEKPEVLFSKEVSVSYGAPFGPDVADLEEWGNLAVEFVDTR